MRIALLFLVLIGNVAGAQATFPVTVHVTDQTGAALASASVSATITGESGAPAVRTDAQGDAVLHLRLAHTPSGLHIPDSRQQPGRNS